MATQKEILGTDIKLIDGDIQFDFNQDFKKISGKENLAQAIKNRLNTGNDELSYYNDYGCRLTTLIGSPNTVLSRNEGRGYLFESLMNEPRIDSVTKTEVDLGSSNDTINVEVSIVSIVDDNEMNLVFNIEE